MNLDLLSLRRNPTGLAASAGAIYAAAVMIYNVINHHGAISAPVLVAGAAAVLFILTRTIVTPTAAPKDGAGRPLVPAADPGLAEHIPPAANWPGGVSPSGNVTLLPAPGLGTTGQPPTATPVA